ncbi:phosphatidate cytidylyltransferase [Streptomyces sp. SL13]|uniref:Phosphatidate cytidylyltransferase n=1 Tax=Streptantibioticus silvisoli TaxID=2705255 RepID=A0AA90H8E3_9ACTN|nr:phosphatidate cytidylyltransferase [Streptantibioticus silvisoli]MDI5972940.1 phosphatidate cytidylyltransferase [Streptantibioticus silvisoli]
MNDSSPGGAPDAGYRGAAEDPAAPGRPYASAGPVYDVAAAAQTRPMPPVPDENTGLPAGPPGTPGGPGEPSGGAGGHRKSGKNAGRNLRAAIGVGVGLGVVIIATLFIYKVIFLAVVVAAVVVGLWELTSRLRERKGINAPLVPLAVGGAATVVAGYAWAAEGAWVATAFTVLAVLLWRMTQSPHDYLKDVTAGVFAVFYVPFLATFVVMMLAAHDGPWRVFVFLLLTVVSDTGAYAVGWRFGKHKLAPRISPGKTREGLLGAVSFAMVAGALSMQYLIDDGKWWQGLVLGLAAAASATVGDLGESMIKRDLGIKDMGTLLPGHGGIMDRLDSLLPTAPVVWLLLVLFVGST